MIIILNIMAEIFGYLSYGVFKGKSVFTSIEWNDSVSIDGVGSVDKEVGDGSSEDHFHGVLPR